MAYAQNIYKTVPQRRSIGVCVDEHNAYLVVLLRLCNIKYCRMSKQVDGRQRNRPKILKRGKNQVTGHTHTHIHFRFIWKCCQLRINTFLFMCFFLLLRLLCDWLKMLEHSDSVRSLKCSEAKQRICFSDRQIRVHCGKCSEPSFQYENAKIERWTKYLCAEATKYNRLF